MIYFVPFFLFACHILSFLSPTLSGITCILLYFPICMSPVPPSCVYLFCCACLARASPHFTPGISLLLALCLSSYRQVFEQLWCAVSAKDQLPKGRAGALHAIAMGASADASLVNDLQRLELVRETALGRATMESRDCRTVRCACIALLR